MFYTDTQALILDAITQYGLAVLGIISVIIVIALAYLIYQVGWYKLLHDQSLTIGGYYIRKTPYKGYNRFRSKSWNLKNTLTR